jgi:ABC-2 type transport system permease protein
MRTTTKVQPLLIQLWDLTLIQLSNWRWSWRGIVLTGMLAPLLSIVALGIFGRDAGTNALQYILIGNLVLALMFDNQNRVSGNFAFMRFMGTLNYFASLPIQNYSLVLATMLAFLLLSLPALLVTLIFGAAFLGLALHPHPLVLLAIPLATLPLSGIGALIGTSARSMEEAYSASMLLTFIMLGLGPVVTHPNACPGWFARQAG